MAPSPVVHELPEQPPPGWISSDERPTHPFGTATFDAVSGPIGLLFVSVSYLPEDGGGVVAAPCGVTAFDGADAGEDDVLFFATTMNV